MISLKPRRFVQSSSSICMCDHTCKRPGSHMCFFSLFFPFVYLELSLFPSIYFISVPFLLPLGIESTSYILSFRMVLFYLVTTGWIFDISLNYVRIQSINQSKFNLASTWRLLRTQVISNHAVFFAQRESILGLYLNRAEILWLQTHPREVERISPRWWKIWEKGLLGVRQPS